MTTGETAAVVGGIYLAVGVGVAAWTVDRASKGKKHFNGIGGSGPAASMVQTVLLWPVAVYDNLWSADLVSQVSKGGTPLHAVG